jgi:hypothetical protein
VGVCAVSGLNGSTLDYTGVGDCYVDANQTGTVDYAPATQAVNQIPIGPGSQTISFSAPASGVVGGLATLTATGGGSGNPVVFSVDPSSGVGVCAVSGLNGATVHFSNVGTCVVDANQAGDANYAAAPRMQRFISVFPPPFTFRHGAASGISVGAHGSVWVIGTDAVAGGYRIYRWNGAGWTAVSGGAVSIAVDPSGDPWVINSAHQIYSS